MKTRSAIFAGITGITLIFVIGTIVSSNETTHENKIRVAYFLNINHAVPIIGMEKGTSEDHNVKILSGAASGGASFIVHPNSKINSVADFAGKRIAAPQIGNTQDISLRSYLSENGLKPSEKGGSVIVLNISNPDIYTLFAKGDIDAAWVPEPTATILRSEER